jgi:hypothetical protein
MADERAVKDRTAAAIPEPRLCNEIQLFDLCDLDACSSKEGRFCRNAELLSAFERISDVEAGPQVLTSEEAEEGEDAGGEEYDDAFGDDGFDDEEIGDDAEYDDR